MGVARLLLAVGISLGLAAEVRAQATKRVDLPGYTFEQLTRNAQTDIMPRVSRSGLVVWSSDGGLPGSVSGTADQEILFWDGLQTVQVTDNDRDDRRPVVNDLGDIVWMTDFGGPTAEIYLRREGMLLQLTDDPLPGVRDRYPDLNDNGIVVWPREVDGQWHVMVFDPELGISPAGPGYRPHLNNLDRISSAPEFHVTDLQGTVLAEVPPAGDLGYALYRRGEISDADQLIIEADPLPEIDPDYEGARDLLLWDGETMTLLSRGVGVWEGRADINSDGVVVWEGFGGLPGAQSGGADREIFVYRPDIDLILQITDDDWDDLWPTIADDGTVVWQGKAGYPGPWSPVYDHEIFRAIPTGDDLDGDGIPDAVDNCILEPNPDQASNALDPDTGRGDACQCGDVTGDGLVEPADLASLRSALAASATLASPRTCGLADPAGECSISDSVVLARALAAPPPASPTLQTCIATSPLR